MDTNILYNVVIKNVVSVLNIHTKLNKTVKRKDRPYWAIILKYEGETVYVNKGKRYVSNLENMIILPKGSCYDWQCVKEGRYFAVEFDLGNNVRSKRTIGAGIKWNWNTSHTMSPPTVFNLFDARVEWRQYFRTRQRQGSGDDKDFFKRLRNKVFTTKREHPRTRRAYFWGIYAHTMNYNLKLGKEGRQGTAYGAGVSLGYTAPLYGYANGAVDIELGGSLGLIHRSYDVYTHDDESNIYAFDPSKSGSGILPIISDVRVAFVYRFMSVENKYKQTRDGERRYDRWEAKQIELKEIENKARFRLDSLFSV